MSTEPFPQALLPRLMDAGRAAREGANDEARRLWAEEAATFLDNIDDFDREDRVYAARLLVETHHIIKRSVKL